MIHHRLRSKSSRNAQEAGPGPGSERTLSDLKTPKDRRTRGGGGGGGGGNCYAFRGQEGNVTVLFHSPILVTAIQLYHPKEAFKCSEVQSTKGGGNAGTSGNSGAGSTGSGGKEGSSSAPRLFRVYGWTTDPSSNSINPLATLGNKASDQSSGQHQDKSKQELPTLLGNFEFFNPCTMTQQVMKIILMTNSMDLCLLAQ